MGIWNSDDDNTKDKTGVPPIKPVTEISELDSDIIQHWGNIQSALGSGSRIEGKLLFDRPVQFDGTLNGEVQAPDALVVIGPTGIADAKIEAAMVVVMGTIKGSIEATEKIEVLSNGKVNGKLKAPRIVLQDGCTFNGTCCMEDDQPEATITEDVSATKGVKEKLSDTLGGSETNTH